jgi:hypothetical protein
LSHQMFLKKTNNKFIEHLTEWENIFWNEVNLDWPNIDSEYLTYSLLLNKKTMYYL